jgi:hypothetical protein
MTKDTLQFFLKNILQCPELAESMGIKVYVRVEDNGEKYAVLYNTELKEEIELKIEQR